MGNSWWILEGVVIAALCTVVIFGTGALVAYMMTRLEDVALRTQPDAPTPSEDEEGAVA